MDVSNCLSLRASACAQIPTASRRCHRSRAALLLMPLAASGLSLPLCADEVKLYNWEAYLAESVIGAFTAETGHTVSVLVFDDDHVRDEVVTSGRAVGFDLIMVETTTLEVLSDQGHFQDISAITAPLAPALDPRWTDACGAYGVPYAWGTTGIIYRTSVARQPINSWRQLFDPPKEHQGRVVMYMDHTDGSAAALLAAGADPFSESQQDLRAAWQLLKIQQPHLLAAQYGYSYAMAHGKESQMSLSFGFAGDVESMNNSNGFDDWAFVVPDEGSVLWGECWAAPAGKPVSEATQAFIAFINRPRIAAQNAEEVWFATPNQAAIPLTSPDYQQDAVLFPPAEVLARSTPYRRLSAGALRLRNRILNSLR